MADDLRSAMPNDNACQGPPEQANTPQVERHIKIKTSQEVFALDSDDHEGSLVSDAATDLSRLSTDQLEFLQTASCLEKGPFDAKILECSTSVVASTVSKLVAEAVHGNFLLPVEHDNNESNASLYQFQSKEVKKQVYQSIISNEKRCELHVAIARRLWKAGYEEALFLHQFMQGEECILQEDASNIAKLCLSEGRRAARASDFSKAAFYLNFGVRLLQKMRDNWRLEYTLSLDLHRASAEANYCDSKFDQAQSSIDAVLCSARCFQDTLGIQPTRLCILGAKGKRQDAILVGLDVLRKLGEPIPKNPCQAHVLVAFSQVQRKIRHKTNESILRLPMMVKEEKIAAMQILNLIFTHAITSSKLMVPLLVFRCVKLTLQHGLNVMSSVAFAKFGMVLCYMGRYRDGRNYAKLALELYERFPVQEWLPRLYLGVYAGVHGCFDSIESIVDRLKYACQVGLETGDMEIALILGFICANTMFTLGRPLPMVQNAFSEIRDETTARKQEWVKNRFSLILQFIENLMGNGGSEPQLLVGDLFDSEARRDICETDMMGNHLFHFNQMVLWYVFGDYDEAVQESHLCRDLYKSVPSRSISFTYYPLISGLSLVSQQRSRKDRTRPKAIRKVRHHIWHLKEHAMRCPSLCSGKLFLLQAELAWLLRKDDVAFFKYTCAISSSSAAGVLFDQALANECAGRYRLHHGDKREASCHFQEAIETYKKWGAHAKAQHLVEETNKLLK